MEFHRKMMCTITSLDTGFKGGEVTPLFFIGATLSNAIAPLLQMPFSTLAALGFITIDQLVELAFSTTKHSVRFVLE
jgi:H+/Cl- antiporter ClcA